MGENRKPNTQLSQVFCSELANNTWGLNLFFYKISDKIKREIDRRENKSNLNNQRSFSHVMCNLPAGL